MENRGWKQEIVESVPPPQDLSVGLKNLLRLLYRNVPLRRRCFLLLRRVLSPPKSVFQHLWFEGRFDAEIEGRWLSLVNYNSKLETALFWAGILGTQERFSYRLLSQIE